MFIQIVLTCENIDIVIAIIALRSIALEEAQLTVARSSDHQHATQLRDSTGRKMTPYRR